MRNSDFPFIVRTKPINLNVSATVKFCDVTLQWISSSPRTDIVTNVESSPHHWAVVNVLPWPVPAPSLV